MPLLALLAACAPAPPPVAAAPAPFHAAVLGDRTGEPDQAAWEETVAQAGRLRPDLVLTVGDLADDDQDDADWAMALAPLRALDVEVQITPGNHDIHDDATAAAFRDRTGQDRYRSVDRGGVHWVIVDNSVGETWEDLDAAQRDWLVGDLRAHADDVVVVLMHKPFWALGVARGQDDPMHALYVDNRVDAVLTGHWHRHSYQEIDGIQYVIVGSSGGASPGIDHPARGNTPELLWITVDGGRLHLATVTAGGAIPVDAVTLADANHLRALERGGVRGTLDEDSGLVSLAVTNPGDAPWQTAIAVRAPGWHADPVDVSVAPGETWTGEVAVTRHGDRLPLPRLELDIDLPDAGRTPFAVPVDLAARATAPRRDAPAVDGALEEWDAPPTIASWVTQDGTAATAAPTALWLAYDDDALYVAARCTDEDPDGIKALHTGRDGQIVYDDRVGLALSTRPDHLLWFYVNPSGHIWDVEKGHDGVVWDRDLLDAAAQIDASGWTMEARVPWAALELDGPPETLRLDARRKQERAEGEAVWTPAFGLQDTSRLGTITLE